MLQAVINIDSLVRGRLCDKLHGRRSHLLFTLQQLSIDSQLFVDNRDLCLSHLHSTLPLGGPRRNIAMTFGTEKLEWCGYPMVKQILKICFFVLTEFTNVTDGRTHRRRTYVALA